MGSVYKPNALYINSSDLTHSGDNIYQGSHIKGGI